MDPIRIDYTNVLADAVGEEHGITPAELDGLAGPSRAALAAVEARRSTDLRWLDLPYQDDVHRRVLAYASSVAGRFENVVVLGIGGSALGNRALHTALNSPYHDVAPPPGQPRLFVMDNVDPDLIGTFLETVDPTKCLFNVISKSGSTAETMSQFLVFRQLLVERLGEEAHRAHVVVTTDAEKGVLRPIVREEGYESFVVPDGVGGRFSVLSPVGLLSSALLGMDVPALLAGAAAMDERCRSGELTENPALLYAAVQSLMQSRKQKNIAVTLSYSHRLRDLADWYAQLLAESIGKRRSRAGEDVFRGPTPVRAVGVTDQHSQVQLYVEGPFDKWFTFLAVEDTVHEVTIPSTYADRDALAYLGGQSMGALFAAEREGTRIALTDAKRPNLTVRFPRVDAASVGQYLYLMELAVAVMGEHYDVDAFDQPGVEAGKVAAYALMGRKGFEARREEIERATAGSQERVI
ncbi:MAG: glucose-6-phosphate isomerase [bacterium]|nr:glucose-6-phosphate isomerase [bacterium]